MSWLDLNWVHSRSHEFSPLCSLCSWSSSFSSFFNHGGAPGDGVRLGGSRCLACVSVTTVAVICARLRGSRSSCQRTLDPVILGGCGLKESAVVRTRLSRPS